jgi:hypothetical protein
MQKAHPALTLSLAALVGGQHIVHSEAPSPPKASIVNAASTAVSTTIAIINTISGAEHSVVPPTNPRSTIRST